MNEIKLLVTDIGGEVCIHDLESLEKDGINETEADTIFKGVGYWLSLALKDANFGMKQQSVRDCAGDDTLLPQKRFAVAVARIEKRVCGAEEKSLPDPTESWFKGLEPPELGDAIDSRIVRAWYPTATKLNKEKTANFIQQWRNKPDVSEAEPR